ncbi:Uncharacterised protein [Acinetobacter baumannii]|nr:Uncharacterised protein [Acinetobacter baumannii]
MPALRAPASSPRASGDQGVNAIPSSRHSGTRSSSSSRTIRLYWLCIEMNCARPWWRWKASIFMKRQAGIDEAPR